MTVKTDFRKIAKAYYNLGLEHAKVRDLTGAAGFLKEALRFDKYCTDARNLLGLIFYEMGDTADALCQWIISLNLDPDAENNRADYYLESIQRKALVIEHDSQLVKRFNQALAISRNSGEDFAIIELRDITRKKPNFVKAQQLLAILYMQAGEYKKAGRALLEVLKIDRYNPLANTLMDEVKRSTGKADKENEKLSKRFAQAEMKDGDVIIPRSRNIISVQKIVLYILAGIIVGVAGFYILVLPTIRKQYVNELNASIVRNSSELSAVNAEAAALSERYEALKEDYTTVSQKLYAYEAENASFTDMYMALNSIINDYTAGNLEEAAKAYLKIDRSLVTQEPLTGKLQEVDRYMLNSGYEAIVSKGSEQWNGGWLTEAEKLYKLAMEIKPGEPEAMFMLARLYQSQNMVNEANALFDRIIGEHPESQYAARASEARGY